MASHIEIAGAGPAGLTAALTIAKERREPDLYEASNNVGTRFHGDFQGLENWTTPGDVLDELASIGIEPTFEHRAFHECVFFDAKDREYSCRSVKPLWYLIRRGPEPGSLDQALKQQALAAGVKIRFNSSRRHLPTGGIVAHGPHRVDAVATGYVFETDSADGAFATVSNRLAPEGYSYLLIWDGKGTVATCQFADFHNSKEYLARTLDYFRQKVGFKMLHPHPFGGFGNLYSSPKVRKGRLLYVGEAAGFQDALFGFGLRYAMLSGHLAAKAWLSGNPESYDSLCHERFDRLLKQAVVNRYLYAGFGDWGYTKLLRTLSAASDPRDWLRRYYGAGGLRSMIYPLARRHFRKKIELVAGCIEGCDCTWCRCQHQIQKNSEDVARCQSQD